MSKIISGDYLKVMRNMAEKSVDAVVTGRPYGLSFIGKRRDYDVPSTEIWAECLPVLKPSDHLQAFAGTRTQQRMAARIEDASFEIPDMIAWIYGSGFPKSHNGPWGHRAQARARADHRCPHRIGLVQERLGGRRYRRPPSSTPAHFLLTHGNGRSSSPQSSALGWSC